MNLVVARHPSHVLGGLARHIDPRLGKQGARAEHKGEIGERVDRVAEQAEERLTSRRRQIVHETGNRFHAAARAVALHDNTFSAATLFVRYEDIISVRLLNETQT